MSTVVNSLFSDSDEFTTIPGASAVCDELMDEILQVQYPESNRGIGRSRADVNNRVKKFVARCKLMHLKADDKDKEAWKAMGRTSVKLHAELRKTKDAVQMIENIW